MLILANMCSARNILLSCSKENRLNAVPRILSCYLNQPSRKTSYTSMPWPKQTVLKSDKYERLTGLFTLTSLYSTSNASCSKHKITFKPYVFPPKQDHDHKNMKLKRPMSPHLEVYKPTVPSITSIMQRVTGSLLTVYAFMMSFGTLFLSNGVETYVCMIQSMNLGCTMLFFIKLIIGFPFTYHYCNGARYAAFNSVKLLDLKGLYASAKLALIAAIALDVLFAFL